MRKLVIGTLAILAAALLVLFFTYSNLVSQEREDRRIFQTKNTIDFVNSAIRNITILEEKYRQAKEGDELFKKGFVAAFLSEFDNNQQELSGFVKQGTVSTQSYEHLVAAVGIFKERPDSLLYNYISVRNPASINPINQYKAVLQLIENNEQKEYQDAALKNSRLNLKIRSWINVIAVLLVILSALIIYLLTQTKTLRQKSGALLYPLNNGAAAIENSSLAPQENEKINSFLDERIDKLKKTEANLHTIFNTTDTIYFLFDNDFKLISYNQRADDFCRQEMKKDIQELKGDLMQEFSPERRPHLSEWLKHSQAGNFLAYETSYVQPDKSVHWYMVKMFPIMGIDKNVFGMMLAVIDITNQKLFEQEIIDKEVQGQKTIIREILKAQENERNKIGQELHDNVNQILASTKLYMNLAYSDHPNNLEFIKTSMKYLDEAVAEIRQLSSIEVTPLTQEKLEYLIASAVETIQQHSDIKIEFNYTLSEKTEIDDDLKLNLYRIVQEQLNNILKHAKASIINIKVEEKNGSVVMLISDNGQGFDPSKNRDGIGISNMINRVRSYNGEIDINSQPQQGCIVSIKIPIP